VVIFSMDLKNDGTATARSKSCQLSVLSGQLLSTDY